MEFRKGKYAVLGGEEFELIKGENSCRLVIRQSAISKNHEQIGFKKHLDAIYVLDLSCDLIESAFNINTFCTYNGNKFEIGQRLKNKQIRIWHTHETQVNLKDFARHGYDPNLEVDENEVDEVWEERIPVPGFKFDVLPIFYIKEKN